MKKPSRLLLREAWPLAEKIAQYLQTNQHVQQLAVAGAVRRRLETVADIELVIASSAADTVLDLVRSMPGIGQVRQQNHEEFSAELSVGIPLHIHVVEPARFIPVLYFHTGSVSHNEQIAIIAQAYGWKFSRRGLNTANGEPLIIQDERQFCRRLGLSYIEPELREGRGEIARARQGEMPDLVQLTDIKGGLHVHTAYSDGRDSIAALAAAAQKRGWSYLGISDHSQSAHYAGGLKLPAILQQRREIDHVNDQHPQLLILAGIECDIRPDGSLDYPDEILAQFDFVVASVHSAFKQDEKAMTRRIIKALGNPYVSMLGHLTGRMLLRRPGYAVDVEAVIEAAARTGTIIEINANPRRLDLDWRWHTYAREQGVLLSINPDAHSADELDYVQYGLAAARKGGLTATDILNTRSAQAVQARLQAKRASILQ